MKVFLLFDKSAPNFFTLMELLIKILVMLSLHAFVFLCILICTM